jgi:hypothetical protein
MIVGVLTPTHSLSVCHHSLPVHPDRVVVAGGGEQVLLRAPRHALNVLKKKEILRYYLIQNIRPEKRNYNWNVKKPLRRFPNIESTNILNGITSRKKAVPYNEHTHI